MAKVIYEFDDNEYDFSVFSAARKTHMALTEIIFVLNSWEKNGYFDKSKNESTDNPSVINISDDIKEIIRNAGLFPENPDLVDK